MTIPVLFLIVSAVMVPDLMSVGTGLVRSIMVLGVGFGEGPLSRVRSTKSRMVCGICSMQLGAGWPGLLALVDQMGVPSWLMSVTRAAEEGMRRAIVSFEWATGLFEGWQKGTTKVSGPGQNASSRARAFSDQSAT